MQVATDRLHVVSDDPNASSAEDSTGAGTVNGTRRLVHNSGGLGRKKNGSRGDGANRLLTRAERVMIGNVTRALLVLVLCTAVLFTFVELAVTFVRSQHWGTWSCQLEAASIVICWCAQIQLIAIRCLVVMAISRRTAKIISVLAVMVLTLGLITTGFIGSTGDRCTRPFALSVAVFLVVFCLFVGVLARFREVLRVARSVTVRAIALCCLATLTCMTLIIVFSPLFGIADNGFIIADGIVNIVISSLLLYRLLRRTWRHRRRVAPYNPGATTLMASQQTDTRIRLAVKKRRKVQQQQQQESLQEIQEAKVAVVNEGRMLHAGNEDDDDDDDDDAGSIDTS
eukprot:TRINITY_DN66198_c1_g1_i1.p1 TRINITY_DN66198_c1_g1~~TRINITY_DN66198_c1_g1_i1.p1  ORF type:complete len:341 (-),score=128.93 TRINITY_DN66198_c1_g1_i1:276-1298(-)